MESEGEPLESGFEREKENDSPHFGLALLLITLVLNLVSVRKNNEGTSARSRQHQFSSCDLRVSVLLLPIELHYSIGAGQCILFFEQAFARMLDVLRFEHLYLQLHGQAAR